MNGKTLVEKTKFITEKHTTNTKADLLLQSLTDLPLHEIAPFITFKPREVEDTLLLIQHSTKLNELQLMSVTFAALMIGGKNLHYLPVMLEYY